MADKSGIGWTEATWNPTTGCTKISSGCKNCYAETLSKRLKAMGLKKYRNNFRLTQHADEVERPLHWKKPKKIFVNSMSDLFHENVEMEFAGRCFSTMVRADWHIYQILTKRPQKMSEFSDLFARYFKFLIPGHIWMGVSVEDNDATWRIRELEKVKCSMRFVSFEPLLADIKKTDLRKIDWAIIGGESGHRYRHVREGWVQNLLEQCLRQNVSVFFKQWGGPRPHSGGRVINGRTYDQFPDTKPDKTRHAERAERLRESSPLHESITRIP